MHRGLLGTGERKKLLLPRNSGIIQTPEERFANRERGKISARLAKDLIAETKRDPFGPLFIFARNLFVSSQYSTWSRSAILFRWWKRYLWLKQPRSTPLQELQLQSERNLCIFLCRLKDKFEFLQRYNKKCLSS